MKRIISIVLISILILTTGCTVIKKEESLTNPLGDFYVISNTERYWLDEKPRVTALDTVNISLAKNETEGGQVSIYSTEKTYSNIISSISELKNSNGEKIPTENIKLYREMFFKISEFYGQENIDVSLQRASANPIIPMEFVDLNTTNTVKGENTVYYFTVKTTAQTTPGKYTGTFTLTYDGGKQDIPVCVNVWNITLPETPTYRTAFAYSSAFLSDYSGWNLNSDEMHTAITQVYDLLNDYKISPTHPDSYILGDTSTPQKYAENLKAYFEKYKGFSTASIPFYSSGPWNDIYLTQDDKEYNLALYDEFRKVGLIDRVYLYCVDEPSLDWQYKMMNTIGTFINTSAPDVRNLVTTEEKNATKGSTNVWCPIVSAFNPDKAKNIREEDHSRYWWYFCNEAPAPTGRMIVDMSNTRMNGWMARDYDIEGLLYWMINIFMHYNAQTGQYEHKDLMFDTDQYMYHGMEGDGVINRNMPISTLILEAVRDSVEDYEYAVMLERQVQKFITANKLDISLEAAMDGYYKSLYLEVNEFPCSEAPDNIEVMREHIANDIINGVDYLMMQEFIPGSGTYNQSRFTIYTKSNADVKVDDNEVSVRQKCGSYDKLTYTYTFKKTYDFVDIKINNNSHIRPVISEKTVITGSKLINLDDENALALIKEANASSSAIFDIVQLDNVKTLKVQFKGKTERINIPKQLFSTIDIGKYNLIRANVMQPDIKSATLNFNITANSATIHAATQPLYKGEYRLVNAYIDPLAEAKITAFKIVVPNVKLAADETFTYYINDVYLLKKDEFKGEPKLPW